MRFTCAILLTTMFTLPGQSSDKDVPRDGLVLWLNASTAATKNKDSHNRALTLWMDGSKNGNDFWQTAEKLQPKLILHAIGDQPAIRFDGNAMLVRDNFRGLSLGDQAFHFVIVFRAPKGGPPSQRIVDINSRAAPKANPDKRRGFWVGFQNRRGIPRLGINHGDEGEAQSVIWDDEPHLLELVYRGEQLFEIHIDGQAEQRAMFNGTHFLGFDQYVTMAIGQHFGSDNHGPTFLRGDVGEILLFSRPLTTPERMSLGKHLANKYSLQAKFEPLPTFEADIRPILAQHCFACHSEKTREAELDLRTVSAILRGGKAGPIIVKGHPQRSELVSILEAKKMPPDDATKLRDEQVALIRRWIKADAPSETAIATSRPAPKVTAKDRQHWAWQKPEIPTPPKSQNPRIRNNVDRFISAKQVEAGLDFSPDARTEQLVRRIYFDLHGLPPTPKEIDEFQNDKSPDRFNKLVNRLLDSHHFGERWGRHWLDVAGFVDVIGSDNDAPIIKPHPGKWRYRDYVIRSFNSDKPFDRFLIEQLAGDELHDWRNVKKFTPEIVESLIATGFLLSANDDTNQNELNTPDTRHHVLQRTSENVANALFAVTLQCAKCHDHKYEAISQLDYYRFEAVFAPVFNVRNWVVANARARADVSNPERTEFDQHNAKIDAEKLSQAKRTYGQIAIATESPATAVTHVLRRGDWLRPGIKVEPELPEIFTTETQPLTGPSPAGLSGRRLALARAVTDENSLVGQHVARVYVNRIWQQLFGRGLVETSGNFGVSGSSPTHPELLDWLTHQFIKGGWRTKPLIRSLVQSTTYQQSAANQKEAAEVDPQNRLRWRMDLRRLDAEQLRDAILTASGRLDRSLGGPPIPLDPRPDGMVVLKTAALPAGTTAFRRSVYILARRNYHLTLMRAFDQPIVARNCSVRKPSAAVTQSLALLHDDFLFEQSATLASQIAKVNADSTSRQIQSAWKIVLGREPTPDELSACEDVFERHAQRFGDQKNPRQRALGEICHMLFNTNEFLYVP